MIYKTTEINSTPVTVPETLTQYTTYSSTETYPIVETTPIVASEVGTSIIVVTQTTEQGNSAPFIHIFRSSTPTNQQPIVVQSTIQTGSTPVVVPETETSIIVSTQTKTYLIPTPTSIIPTELPQTPSATTPIVTVIPSEVPTSVGTVGTIGAVFPPKPTATKPSPFLGAAVANRPVGALALAGLAALLALT